MFSQFLEFIKSNNLFTNDDKILVAVSGGADSVTLTDLISKLNNKFGIAHCNFCLRDSESDADEIFVEKLAEKYHVPFFYTRFETKKFAFDNKLSIEEAARNLRYNWFNEICNQNNYSKIATGHHADDSIETFFINLTSGTGLRGICGIKPINGIIVRPLLFAFRQEIENYCTFNELSYRTDKTNFETIFIRNKFRHQIIPEFTKINSNFKSTILKSIKIFKDVEKIYLSTIENAKKKCITTENQISRINISELLKTEAPETFLYEFLNPFGFHSDICKNIFNSINSISGKIFESKTHKLIKDRSEFIISTKINIIFEEIKINREDKTTNTLPPLSFIFFKNTNNFSIDKNINSAAFDADKLEFPLTIRKWKLGDYFFPLGMKNKKLVSDFLVDLKINLFDKKNIFVITSNDEIIWIVGKRIDNRFKIQNETKNIYKIVLEQ